MPDPLAVIGKPIAVDVDRSGVESDSNGAVGVISQALEVI
jgi:hypothetical protein